MFSGVEAAAALDQVAFLVGAQRLTDDQLHKLLYYAQGIALAHGPDPLFKGRFQAATHGPVMAELAEFVRTNSKDWWVRLRDRCPSMDGPLTETLRDVHLVFGSLGSLDLSRATQSELPWLRAREGMAWNDRRAPEIPDTFIRDYFAEAIEFGEDIMTDLVLGSIPGQPAWSMPFRLSTNVRFISGHPFFDQNEARRLRVALGFGPVPEDWSEFDFSPPRSDTGDASVRRLG